MIPGCPPLTVTCSGACIAQPDESVQTLSFKSLARKSEIKSIKLSNPTDKDWFISPSLSGDHWQTPFEIKVPAKSSADLNVTYFPLTMTTEGKDAQTHIGKLFIALPDGSALLYNLTGEAGPPECSGKLEAETTAKKPAMVSAKIINWLGETQKFSTSIEMIEKPSPACFLVAANAVEVGPHGVKEFHMRFLSFVEGSAKAKITFTNIHTGEFNFNQLSCTYILPMVMFFILCRRVLFLRTLCKDYRSGGA
jgi:hydrocephalus-inducing protein